MRAFLVGPRLFASSSARRLGSELPPQTEGSGQYFPLYHRLPGQKHLNPIPQVKSSLRSFARPPAAVFMQV